MKLIKLQYTATITGTFEFAPHEVYGTDDIAIILQEEKERFSDEEIDAILIEGYDSFEVELKRR